MKIIQEDAKTLIFEESSHVRNRIINLKCIAVAILVITICISMYTNRALDVAAKLSGLFYYSIAGLFLSPVIYILDSYSTYVYNFTIRIYIDKTANVFQLTSKTPWSIFGFRLRPLGQNLECPILKINKLELYPWTHFPNVLTTGKFVFILDDSTTIQFTVPSALQGIAIQPLFAGASYEQYENIGKKNCELY